MNKHDWILGGYQWIAFEHRGEAVWPRICSVSGAIDMFLQKKDAFFQNQSHWLDKKTVHLMPHWNFKGCEGEKIWVWAYTNCEECELFVNGNSKGIYKVEKFGHAQWEVEYEPGTIYVEARENGKTVCTDMAVTTGETKKLGLRLDNSVKANGKDVAVITCFCLDKNGNEIPDAAPYVFFSCNGLGNILGTGSSNTDHVPVTENYRKMYAGKITLAVKVGDKNGILKVFAKSDGLETACLSIELK